MRLPISRMTFCTAETASVRVAMTVVRATCGVSSARVAMASSKVGHCVQNVLLTSMMWSLDSPSKASMIAPLDATWPNVVHGLTSWNLRASFRVESNEHIFSDADERVW
ncbi:hypothetical protein HanXRQr2_Chr15g0682631 [Helianthus annuus]|uniref:Uncharacterized protein n=1 Tax=Helianthus annuus TaxID=4232 RepID=A0A9K3H233_HELAN|nr:hypothetical protein HanXRQr2_Chr15g0682631 [Helianthus annuus]KAJ0830359.1 hypothetical protein HanPSC8_Chr15g0654541 [Helianthus annuus]